MIGLFEMQSKRRDSKDLRLAEDMAPFLRQLTENSAAAEETRSGW